jgi:hypothetical protein
MCGCAADRDPGGAGCDGDRDPQWAVVVDAKNDAAHAFYFKHEFIALPHAPQRLFLPMLKSYCPISAECQCPYKISAWNRAVRGIFGRFVGGRSLDYAQQDSLLLFGTEHATFTSTLNMAPGPIVASDDATVSTVSA